MTETAIAPSAGKKNGLGGPERIGGTKTHIVAKTADQMTQRGEHNTRRVASLFCPLSDARPVSLMVDGELSGLTTISFSSPLAGTMIATTKSMAGYRLGWKTEDIDASD